MRKLTAKQEALVGLIADKAEVCQLEAFGVLDRVEALKKWKRFDAKAVDKIHDMFSDIMILGDELCGLIDDLKGEEED